MPANETPVNLTKPWNECLCLTEPEVHLASVAWLFISQYPLFYFNGSDFRMTLKNGFGKCLLFVLLANG